MEPPAKRLMLFFVGISGLLALYVLCVSWEIQVPWQIGTIAHFRTAVARYVTRRYDTGENSLPMDTIIAQRDPSGPPGQDNDAPTDLENSVELSVKTSLKEPTSRSKQPTTTPTTTTTTTTTTVPPTKPDFTGDRYASEVFPSQTHCPGNIRSRVSNTSYADKFLKSIPVLQWAKHATAGQYNRLKYYPGAHGWGNLKFDLLKDCLSVLNTTANGVMFDDWEERPNRSECIRCAVVGNGGILNGSKMGLEIDQHDYVFRTNGAVIKGYEQDVGSRTSFYTFSTNTMRNSMRTYGRQGYNGPPLAEETRYIFLPDHDRDYMLMRASAMHTPIDRGPEKSSKPPKYFGENASVRKFKMYHPDFVRYLRNRFLRSSILNGKYKNIYRPSTGAVMLLAALHTCDQVSAYGFMTPDYNKYSDHYYDKKYHRVGFYANHDFRLEMKLWQGLHKAGLLKLYMHE